MRMVVVIKVSVLLIVMTDQCTRGFPYNLDALPRRYSNICIEIRYSYIYIGLKVCIKLKKKESNGKFFIYLLKILLVMYS